MNDKINPQAWILLRAKEPEFPQFLGTAATEPEAIAAEATVRCQDAQGNFAAGAFEKLKEDYLGFCRRAWGLPAGAGATL